MSNDKELSGTTECETLQTRCHLNRCYNGDGLYLEDLGTEGRVISKAMGREGVGSNRLAEYDDTWWALDNTAVTLSASVK